MLRKMREARGEEGFTLIELLVVVIIIGILAAIAIPTFLNQREKAWKKAAQSDLRNNAVKMEEYFDDNGSYPTAPPTGDYAFKESENVTVTVTTAAGVTDFFCLSANHSKLGATGSIDFVLSSADGRPLDTTATGYAKPTECA